jgi:hypothetical protein
MLTYYIISNHFSNSKNKNNSPTLFLSLETWALIYKRKMTKWTLKSEKEKYHIS